MHLRKKPAPAPSGSQCSEPELIVCSVLELLEVWSMMSPDRTLCHLQMSVSHRCLSLLSFKGEIWI